MAIYPPPSTPAPSFRTPGMLRTLNGDFIDLHNRLVLLKGINLDAAMKLPTTPHLPSYAGGSFDPVHPNLLYDADGVSFIGRPFPLEEAETHLTRIKNLGFNTIRYIITWEALEHEGPGKYDDGFISYTLEILRRAHAMGGFYIFFDMHQDVWSRFCGGSGAPMWTLYAAGMEPRNFGVTEAAILHCEMALPQEYTKMVWSTNYFKLAAATMFTLFFGGEVFAPRCVLNGVNIQRYLQNHFNDAWEHFWARVVLELPEVMDTTVIGFESMNEPSCGFIGTQNVSELCPTQVLKLGLMPSVIQAMRLGMGEACTVDEFEISVFGPRKKGSRLIDPKGVRAWVDAERGAEMDAHYGFERASSWPLGTCLWALHGVWDPVTLKVLHRDYFGKHGGTTINEEWFINEPFVDFYKEFKTRVRKVHPTAILLIQPPVMQIPPSLIGTGVIDDRTVYAPHYYDGMSLMFKTWNRRYNVDTLGILRGRYLNPALGVVLGESRIRECIKSQFAEIRKEGLENLGPIPVLLSETGMPFDMDKKKAYQSGRYESQTRAWDALGYALEGNNLNVTYWTYCSLNGHEWGDDWNNEDFSIWSANDRIHEPAVELDGQSFESTYKPLTRLRELETGSVRSQDTLMAGSSVRSTPSRLHSAQSYSPPMSSSYLASSDGIRAVDALARPYPMAINGRVLECKFDLSLVVFTLKIDAVATGEFASVIYLPKWHFCEEDIFVEVSNGRFEYREKQSVLAWYHTLGEHTLRVSKPESAKPASVGCFEEDCVVM